MGLHFKAWANTGILLIDEIELGLEPSRIRSLINLLTNIAETKGTQIIITTHSPITLSECSANQIEVVRTGKDGLVESFNLGNCNDLFDIKYLGLLFSLWSIFQIKGQIKSQEFFIL